MKDWHIDKDENLTYDEPENLDSSKWVRLCSIESGETADSINKNGLYITSRCVSESWNSQKGSTISERRLNWLKENKYVYNLNWFVKYSDILRKYKNYDHLSLGCLCALNNSKTKVLKAIYLPAKYIQAEYDTDLRDSFIENLLKDGIIENSTWIKFGDFLKM